MGSIFKSIQEGVGTCHFGSSKSSREVQTCKLSFYQNDLQLHVDLQVICGSLWYLMCLNARIRPTVGSWHNWDNFMTGQGADATVRSVSDIYVIVLLHYYLLCGDALILKGMPMPCSRGPSPPMFTLCRPRSYQCLVVPAHERGLQGISTRLPVDANPSCGSCNHGGTNLLTPDQF